MCIYVWEHACVCVCVWIMCCHSGWVCIRMCTPCCCFFFFSPLVHVLCIYTYITQYQYVSVHDTTHTAYLDLYVCLNFIAEDSGTWWGVFLIIFPRKWAISHIAWSLIVSLCKSIQELQLKCSLMWYNWCLPNPLFAHLPVSLNF